MLDVLSTTRPGFAGQVSASTSSSAPSPTPTPAVTGRRLAHAKLTASQRAGIAAAIQLGELHHDHPTEGQVAEVCRVACGYVRKARRASPSERQQLLQGHVTVARLSRPPSPKKQIAWAALDDDELEAAVRDAGVGRIWDAIVRVID